MSEITPERPRRRRRADAERSIEAILGAAVRTLNARPDASIEAIAGAAGVTRQTVYAHFSSREALLAAVLDRVTPEVLAAMDGETFERGPPVDALDRFLAVTWQMLAAYPFLLSAGDWVDAAESRARHIPIVDRLEALVRRGQRSGDFDRHASPGWLAAATIALGHAAAEEVAAGHMSTEQAGEALRDSVRRVFAARPPSAERAPQRRAPTRGRTPP